MSEGIRVALPNKSLSSNKNIAFSSEFGHLGLDVRHTPKMFDLVKYTFTSVPTIPGVNNTTTQNMLTINHNLGYVPVVLVYIYDYATTASYISPNSYQMGSMSITGAGQVQQTITHSVDNRNLTVDYSIFNGSSNPSAAIPYDLSGAKFAIKYFIFTNDLMSTDS